MTFEINEQGLTAPTEVSPGLINVTLKNSGQAPHVLFVSWLAEGVTAQAILDAPPPGDPNKSNVVGGLFMTPGLRFEVMLNFTANRHYFVSEVFVEKPHFVEFAASGKATVNAAPSPSVTIEAAEFAYVMPDKMQAGAQWWQVTNKGKQTHDLGIYKLEGDQTLAKVQAQLSAGDEKEQAPPAVTTIPSWAVGAGQTTWIQFDFPAGEYAVLCRVPDFSTTPPGPDHWHKGMVRTFTVVK